MENKGASRILVVGAGGIGCEALKNLVQMGGCQIELLDMDTVETSNLSRQFLFQRVHVGQSKSLVAAESISRYGGGGMVVAHHGDIHDRRFSRRFFSRFDLVLAALDNLEARRRVNLMCLAVGVPLVETGSSGYMGQAAVIIPGRTECYDCQPKQSPQTFPVCTIRSKPTLMIHCVLWAREYLFGGLFGGEELDQAWTLDDPHRLASGVFAPLCFEAVAATDRGHCSHTVWPLAQQMQIFVTSLARLTRRGVAEMRFDKDDEDMMDLIASAANLRATVFGIETQTAFAIKTMAGNIIPAVSTTNAVVAGLAAVEVGHLLSGRSDLCRATYYMPGHKEMPFVTEQPSPPNPACVTCSRSVRIVPVDFVHDTLQSLSHTPLVTLMVGARIIYDPECATHWGTALSDLGLADGDVVYRVADDGEACTLILEDVHRIRSYSEYC